MRSIIMSNQIYDEFIVTRIFFCTICLTQLYRNCTLVRIGLYLISGKLPLVR